MNEIMGTIDILCKSLYSKSQDVLNALRLVSYTVETLQQLRQDGWNVFL